MNSKIRDTPCDGCVYNWRDKKCQMTPISNQPGKCLVCGSRDTCLQWNPNPDKPHSTGTEFQEDYIK